MKIGILSLKYTCNYGGILQSFALQEILKKFGYDVEIINYKSSHRDSKLHNLFFRLTNLFFSGNIISLLHDKKREKNKEVGSDSDELIKNNEVFMSSYLNRGKLVDEDSIIEYCHKFDCIIVGSDQIWSVTNSSFLVYFIDWKFKGEKIAFSACSVKKVPALLNRKKIRKALNSFDAVSVRDTTTAEFVRNTNGLYPIITTDPTLMYDFRPYIGERLIKERYILLYILGDEINGGNLNALDIIKRKLGINNLKVVSVILPSVSLVGKKGADLILDKCDPLMWLNLIFYAEFIFTDSFHGCMFSINFNKPFIGYYSYEKRATRLLDIKSRYNLKNIIRDITQLDKALDSSMQKDSLAIQQHVDFSLKFLIEQIEK